MKKLVVAAVFVGIIISVGYWYTEVGEVKMVYLTDTGFEPNSVKLEAGDWIKFVAAAEVPVWPASDSHPTHGMYPAFDPKEPLEPGDTWKFRFEEPGIWDFHDHLRPEYTGSVAVTGEFGEAAAVCFDIRLGTNRASCWENDFVNIIDEAGFDAAFDAFVDRYQNEPGFIDVCHDIMHYVGRAAYEVYQSDNEVIVRPETSMCGYGFYHGFIEQAIEESGFAALPESRQYCFDVEELMADFSPNMRRSAGDSCLHGVGHAVFDSLDGSLWGDPEAMMMEGISLCEQTMENDWAAGRCASGVFNSMTTAMNNNYYNLSYPTTTPWMLCETTKADYRPDCYMEMGAQYTQNQKLTIEEALAFTSNFPQEEYVAAGIFAIMDGRLRFDSSNVERLDYFAELCRTYQNSAYYEACVNGVVLSLANLLIGEEQVAPMSEFCEAVSRTEAEKQVCYKRAVTRVSTHVSLEELDRICAETTFAPYCPNR